MATQQSTAIDALEDFTCGCGGLLKLIREIHALPSGQQPSGPLLQSIEENFKPWWNAAAAAWPTADVETQACVYALIHDFYGMEKMELPARWMWFAEHVRYQVEPDTFAHHVRKLEECLATLKVRGNTPGKPTKAKDGKRRAQQRQPTEAQIEALKVVGECQLNFTEAGRRLRKDPKTVRQHYKAGLKNAGRLAPNFIGKPSPRHTPQDSRGQLDVAGNDDGPASGVLPTRRVKRDRR